MSAFVSHEDLKAAISCLDVAANLCESNEPINRAHGFVAQANLERDNARAYRGAISILKERLI